MIVAAVAFILTGSTSLQLPRQHHHDLGVHYGVALSRINISRKSPFYSQVCQYDGSTGGTELSPLLVNCCCNRCDTDKITCAADSVTGSGLWQTTKYSPLCPEEPCGSYGK